MNPVIRTAAFLLATSSVISAEAAMNTVSQQFEVASRDGKVLVTLTVDNRSAKPVHVPKAVAQETELFHAQFEIRDKATGKVLQYVGPMVKRGPITAADFVTVKPNSTHRHTIDITQSYDFLPGQHRYELRYVGYVLPTLKQVNALSPAQVAPVSFTHAQG